MADRLFLVMAVVSLVSAWVFDPNFTRNLLIREN